MIVPYCDLTSEQMLFWASLLISNYIRYKEHQFCANTHTAGSGIGSELTNQSAFHQYFCGPKWKRKQTNKNKSMGNVHSPTSVLRNLKETRKHEKTLLFKEAAFSYEIYAGTSKATHKVFQQRGAFSIREFSILHNLQFFAWKLWLKTGCAFNQGCVLK